MGRPRRHDQQTAAVLLAKAEEIAEREGLDALTLRHLADRAGTTTRAVYTVFGSKEDLLVALGRRAFEILRTSIDALPVTDDPLLDLVEAGVEVFRRFAIEHPSLFHLGVQRLLPDPGLASEFSGAAGEALAGLRARIERAAAAGLLGDRAVRDVTLEFHALCEGLAAVELRSLLPAGEEERVWRDALTALVRGFTIAPDAASPLA
jgi:AcrR family transcriptional regulator